jgi:hypothetical protein
MGVILEKRSNIPQNGSGAPKNIIKQIEQLVG